MVISPTHVDVAGWDGGECGPLVTEDDVELPEELRCLYTQTVVASPMAWLFISERWINTAAMWCGEVMRLFTPMVFSRGDNV